MTVTEMGVRKINPGGGGRAGVTLGDVRECPGWLLIQEYVRWWPLGCQLLGTKGSQTCPMSSPRIHPPSDGRRPLDAVANTPGGDLVH